MNVIKFYGTKTSKTKFTIYMEYADLNSMQQMLKEYKKFSYNVVQYYLK